MQYYADSKSYYNTPERRIKTCMWKSPVIKKTNSRDKKNFFLNFLLKDIFNIYTSVIKIIAVLK